MPSFNNFRRTKIRDASIRSIADQIKARGLRSVPLSGRVEYSYFDDHEMNVGDIGWLVIDGHGEICGLDEDMTISLARFSDEALLEIESRIMWALGTAEELASEGW